MKIKPSLPLFPLTGLALFPQIRLPLRVFEPRYVQMVQDAWDNHQKIGLIQPHVPQNDNQPDLTQPPTHPDLYAIGGMGSILDLREHEGFWLLLLKGESRFEVIRELPLNPGGYREVEYTTAAYAHDTTDTPDPLRVAQLKESVEAQGVTLGTSFEVGFSDTELVHALAGSLPMSPAERQALLEAPTINDRLDLLNRMLHMQPDMVSHPKAAWVN